MRQDQLIEVFKIILKDNPKAILSGSLGLALQKIKLNRAPEDIDIYLPFGEIFVPIDGAILKDAVLYLNNTWQEIEKEKNKRVSFDYSGIFNNILTKLKIDVFQPRKKIMYEQTKVYFNEIPCIHFSNILKFKTIHALNGNQKHRNDLIYILNNNESKIEEEDGEILSIQDEKNISPLLNIKLLKPLIFFDTETTGIDKVKDRIVELSTIKYFPDGKRELITQKFNPTIPIPEFASKIHGIYDEDVKNQPTFADKANELSNYFQNCDLAGYNIIFFDVPIVVEEFLRAGVSLPFNGETKYLDALKIFYDNEKRDLTSAYKFYCNKDLTDAHSAEADTSATIEVLNRQIEKYDLVPSVDSLHAICNDSEIIDYERKFIRNEDGEIVFTFGKHKDKYVKDERDYLKWMLTADFSNYTKLVIQKIIDGKLI
jgi:DNA polymerase-3 subunit epsilon